jgi:signal transduction histidine kinase
VADIAVDGGRHEDLDPVLREAARPEDEPVALRRSGTRLLLATDADRRAIERALHDGLQQLLVALAVELRRARGLMAEDPAAAEASLDAAAAVLHDAIDEAAGLAQWIHPPRLVDGRSLAIALRAAAERLSVVATIEVLSPALEASPESVASIYWCCAEALSLAPAGTRASISVAARERAVRFDVDLAGSYVGEPSERLRDRVEMLGGWLDVGEAVGGRSRISGLVPSP